MDDTALRGVGDSSHESFVGGLEVDVKVLRGVGGINPLVRYGGAVGRPQRSVGAERQQL